MTARYTELLTGLASHLGLPEPQRLADVEELRLDDLVIAFQYRPLDVNEPIEGDVAFYAALGAPDDARRGEVQRLLLEANHLWTGTGGATLGVQRDTGTVVLGARLPVEGTEPAHLAEMLAVFLDTANFWRAVVAGETVLSQTAQAPASHLAAFGQRA
ncbi:type III secretion system chaperone [Bordetella genomosp. 1]|nr:type III secretion system chaperone [Bordetella genomosp. 1]